MKDLRDLKDMTIKDANSSSLYRGTGFRAQDSEVGVQGLGLRIYGDLANSTEAGSRGPAHDSG